MSSCQECWGTGYYRGFGRPCMQGCKPPSAVTHSTVKPAATAKSPIKTVDTVEPAADKPQQAQVVLAHRDIFLPAQSGIVGTVLRLEVVNGQAPLGTGDLMIQLQDAVLKDGICREIRWDQSDLAFLFSPAASPAEWHLFGIPLGRPYMRMMLNPLLRYRYIYPRKTAPDGVLEISKR